MRSLNNKHSCKWSDNRKWLQMTPRLHIADVATYQHSIIIIIIVIITDMTKRDQHGNYY